jgi:translocation and assembly module TamB
VISARPRSRDRRSVLLGAVNTVRGTYDFQGRRFEVLRDGGIRFVGEPVNEMDPLLDIRARRIISGVEARVNVRGSVKQPEIELCSTPPLEQADILSLIVFNQPLNQLGEGDQISLLQRAQSLAGGVIAGRAGAVDWQRARRRHLRDQPGAGRRRPAGK